MIPLYAITENIIEEKERHISNIPNLSLIPYSLQSKYLQKYFSLDHGITGVSDPNDKDFLIIKDLCSAEMI